MLAEVNSPLCHAGTCRPGNRWVGGRAGGEHPVLYVLWCACLWAFAQSGCLLLGMGRQLALSGACHGCHNVSSPACMMLAELNSPSCHAGTSRRGKNWVGGHLGGEHPVLSALRCACLWAFAQSGCLLLGMGRQLALSGACHGCHNVSSPACVMLTELNSPSCHAGTSRRGKNWVGGHLGGEHLVLSALRCACL